MAPSERSAEERLDEVQKTVDEVRNRLPEEPGFEVADPNTKPLFPADTDNEETPTDTSEGSEVTGTP